MKALLVGSGQYINKLKLIEDSKSADIIIAIDGGMDHLIDEKIKADLIIGDLDSLSDLSLDYINKNKIEKIQYPSEKDYTDMEIGIEYLRDRGAKKIVIHGGIGSRLDHSLANMYLLERIDRYGMSGRIEDFNNTILLVKDSLSIEAKKGFFISVIPIYREGAVVSLEGFKYPLDRYRIDFGATIGISNEILKEEGIITIDEGKVLVFISKD